MPDFEYSDKSSAEQDIKDLRGALDVTPEIADGKWVMISKAEFEAIRAEAENVIGHLESCINEIEGIEIPEPDDGGS
ncbi:hypothetical protein D3093_35150 (plasmid) [Azospirillum argentinense]|uniref:Uncharacterized protein n=1 Tax=Azospirillum argentinense TaxID=2970906 RepID=A0A4D8PT07_9PROT|nr:hypothetical protein [Azospirillum argentinense]QCO00485.1 hypothetical protein D3093_35150 [Azospirillum argentinense]